MNRTYDLGNSIFFSLSPSEKKTCRATIKLGPTIIAPLYARVVESQKMSTTTHGFSQGSTPSSYIEYAFKKNINEHLQELLYNYCVTSALHRSLRAAKIAVVGSPEIIDIQLKLPHEALFVFEIMPISPCIPQDIHKYPFKAPERKNYKDLDRQVATFLKEEHERETQANTKQITIGDWVCFEVQILGNCQEPLCQNFNERLWLRISDEPIDELSRSLFIGKAIGDSFATTSQFLQEYLSTELDTCYTFLITIVDHIPYAYFSLELFKKHFRLKTPRETHAKLIEVFSHRNDISQRRETVEAVFKLLRSHSNICIPKEYIDQQRAIVLAEIQKNPDYLVYKSQHDFMAKVQQLAEKQLAEMALIDQLSFEQELCVTNDDIAGYLNLLKRARTKEFIYFDLPHLKNYGLEQPIPAELVARACLREKTLNMLIHQLAKR